MSQLGKFSEAFTIDMMHNCLINNAYHKNKRQHLHLTMRYHSRKVQEWDALHETICPVPPLKVLQTNLETVVYREKFPASAHYLRDIC